MPRYNVNNNPQANGDHEVHKAGCIYNSFTLTVKSLKSFNNSKYLDKLDRTTLSLSVNAFSVTAFDLTF